jgi:hypothetical protein
MTAPDYYDPTVESWPDDPADLLRFVRGIPDDGQRRLALALATALVRYQAVVDESAAEHEEFRARIGALEAGTGVA